MPTTLLVEGDDALASLLHEVLRTELGHQVIRARDCTQAWHLFQQQQPAALLLDLTYPYDDDLDLCDRVLAAAAPQPVSVVVLTARPDDALAARPRLTVLTKPFEIADLLHALRASATRLPISGNIYRPSPLM